MWGTYMIKVDTIAGLRSTRAEMDQIWKNVVKTAVPEKQAITMIAFRGQNRSEAQYVVSGSTAASEGTGVVQQLSLIVAWDRGSFNGFTWYNQGPCDSCGGLTSATCVQTQYEPSVQKYPQSSCACEWGGGRWGEVRAARCVMAGCFCWLLLLAAARCQPPPASH